MYSAEFSKGCDAARISRDIAQVIDWEQKIRRYEVGFTWKQIPGLSGKIVKAQIVSPRFGASEYTTWIKFYDAMEEMAVFYQVNHSKPLGPSPRWLDEKGKDFWCDITRHVKKYRHSGTWIEHFGKKLKLDVTENDGLRETRETTTQLIWLRVVYEATGRIDISMMAFLYLPQISSSDEPLLSASFRDWNHSMYHYIEREKIRPDIAREKLAGVNSELYKILLKAFFGSGAAGIVNVSGTGAIIADLVTDTNDLVQWFRDYTSSETQEGLKWYREFMSNQ